MSSWITKSYLNKICPQVNHLFMDNFLLYSIPSKNGFYISSNCERFYLLFFNIKDKSDIDHLDYLSYYCEIIHFGNRNIPEKGEQG